MLASCSISDVLMSWIPADDHPLCRLGEFAHIVWKEIIFFNGDRPRSLPTLIACTWLPQVREKLGKIDILIKNQGKMSLVREH